MILHTDAAAILNAKKCGDIFHADKDKIKAEYRALMGLYHPDICSHPQALEIAQNITTLYTRAIELLDNDSWEASNMIYLSTGKRRIGFRYQTMHDFELGQMYIGSTKIVYIINAIHERYYNNALHTIPKLKYANDKMKNECSRYMPCLYEYFKMNNGDFAIVLAKTADTLYLPDVWQYMQQQIPAKHIAWIISRLSNIACFLGYNQIVHHGININNCFISPPHHSVMLFGGWWYTTSIGDPIIGTTKDIYDIMPIPAKTSKISDQLTDLESIKLLGRNLIKTVDTPPQITKWLDSTSDNNPITEFSKWGQTLDKAYGKRKFINFDIDEIKLYEKR